MKKKTFLLLLIHTLFISSIHAQHYVGGDISLLPEYEKAGAKYFDHDKKPIADLVPWLKEEGMNAMRIRLFVNPQKYKQLHENDTNSDTRFDPNACQDVEYILPLCRRIVDAGLDLMLDFHYSDTWADPAKQWLPIDWENKSENELFSIIYSYTKSTLERLKESGITLKFIQPGNEISYGMLWGALGSDNLKKSFMGSNDNWEYFGKLLSHAIKACREVYPDAKIVLHTERVGQVDVQKNFYDMMKRLNIDYDIIGLSYYPYFHGDLSTLDSALSSLEQNYPDKRIMIVETGYSYKWEVPGTTHHLSDIWPYTEAGQNKFARDLISTLEKHPTVNGLFWWWMEYNAYGTNLSGWYNAPLFDSTTGCATSALKTICSFASSSGVKTIESNTCSQVPKSIFDLSGRPISHPKKGEIYIREGQKFITK